MVSQLHSQVDTLVRLGYPNFFAMTAKEFEESLRPLEQFVAISDGMRFDPSNGRMPFVLVVRSARTPVAVTLPLVSRRGKLAIERLYPKKPDDFTPIPSVSLPEGDAYLLREVDRGSETLNVTPDEAYQTILRQGRSPLTVEEGVAVLTQFRGVSPTQQLLFAACVALW
ncbi:MAG: DUF5701 family protein [Anaerolineae bacterium]